MKTPNPFGRLHGLICEIQDVGKVIRTAAVDLHILSHPDVLGHKFQASELGLELQDIARRLEELYS